MGILYVEVVIIAGSDKVLTGLHKRESDVGSLF